MFDAPSPLSKTPEFPRDLREAALIYARLGWRVMPVNGKQPSIKDWPNNATTSEATISYWFGNHKGIGILTGPESGLVALDIDPRNGGELSLKRLEEKLGKLPTTVTAATGGGGWHYLFRWFPGSQKCKPAKGIDFQHSAGRMIVAAPSAHPDTGVLYKWIISPLEAQLADLPSAWRDYLSNNTGASERTAELTKQDNLYSAAIPEGLRNETLFRLGCALRYRGQSAAIITTAIHEANLERCQPPLSDEEAFEIVQNVLRTITEGKSLKTQWQEGIASDPTLAPRAKMVAFGLSMFADVNGKSCFPNQKQIGDKVCLDPKTVRNHLETLDETGWLKRYTREREGAGYSYGYVLTLKDGEK